MHIPAFKVQHLHFIGIGGIGMSGIAEILHNLGYRVKGSDIADNYNTQRLQAAGIEIIVGHRPENIQGAQVVVVSSAVRADNPEVLAARKIGIPVIQRAEMLAELMRLKKSIAISGTHGKTTTTSMAAALLDAAGIDPTVINGGIINAYNTNARLGTGEWAVVEADESDGSFTKLPATIAVVTNIDPEHMEFYGTVDVLNQAFLKFISNIPFYGLAVLCADHPAVMTLLPRINDRRFVTYGFSETAMVRAVNLRQTAKGTTFDVEMARPLPLQAALQNTNKTVAPLPRKIKDLFLPMVGRHNVQNALSVIAIADELGLDEAVIRKAFDTFKGVKRRFTHTGTVNGVTIIDDYAHHPVEIKTVIEAAKQAAQGRIWVVMQPHRYSRLHHLFEDFSQCFEGAHQVMLAPVYSANEDPIPGATSEHLAEALQKNNISTTLFYNPEELAPLLQTVLLPGDMVLCLGAGNITQWAAALPGQLANLNGPVLKQKQVV